MNEAVTKTDAGTVEQAEQLVTITPAVDVVESAGDYQIFADLPGVRNEDLKLTVEGGKIQLEAIAHYEKPAAIRRHYPHVRFARSFSLGRKVDQDRIEASLQQGVLTITLPKQERVQPRRIAIQN
jgi:HSP20 family molecular chaperone IbpA